MKNSNNPTIHDDFHCKIDTIARLFDVNIRTVQKWVQLRNCPKADRGVYNLKSVFDWYMETMIGNDPDSKAIEEVKLKYWTWKAEKEKIAVETAKGELMPKADISQQWALRLAHAKSTFTNFSDRLPPLLVGKDRNEIQAIMKSEVNDVLTNYCR